MDDIIKALSQAVLEGDDVQAASLTKEALAAGLPALEILEKGAVAGIHQAGEKWEQNEYFLPEVILAADAFKASMKLLDPEVRKAKGGQVNKKLVIGVVEGDVHELGKSLVTAGLLSLITWIPGLLLFGIQASLAGAGWLKENLYLAGSILLASWIWILLVSALSLALSAWVKWRLVAGGLMLVVFFLGTGLAQTIKAVLRTTQGYWIDLGANIGRVWLYLFRIRDPQEFSVEEAAASLLLFSAFCIYLLARKVRAYEVVRG